MYTKYSLIEYVNQACKEKTLKPIVLLSLLRYLYSKKVDKNV